MRYAASEKLEIIRTVETSHLPVRRTLDKIGIAKTTFYTWLDRYAAGGFDALEDRKPKPSGGQGCSPITGHPTSRASLPTGSKTRICATCAESPIIR
jgi:transposase-like protein